MHHTFLNIGRRLRVRQEGAWCDLDVQSSACVELVLPAEQCVLRRDDGLPLAGYQVTMELHIYSETTTYCSLNKFCSIYSRHNNKYWYSIL